MAQEAESRWGDDKEEDGDDIPELPPRRESEIDVNGVKTITTYRTDDMGNKVKTEQKVKVTKKTVKIQKAVLARRSWDKFGLEKGKPAGYHGRGFTDPGTVNLDVHEQILDMTPKARVVEESNESAQRAFEKMNIGSFEAWRPKQRGDASVSAAREWAEANGIAAPERDEPGGGGGGSSLPSLAGRAASGGSAYVTPRMRNADGSRNTEMAQRDDSCTVRVSNLSEDVKDGDLRELFRRFGNIQRIYLAKDRETQQSRGFAFINFYDREDAARAIAALDGHGYDHLILSVSWANPSGASNGGGGGGGGGGGPGGSSGPGGGSGDRFGGGSSGDARREVSGSGRWDAQVHNPAFDRYR